MSELSLYRDRSACLRQRPSVQQQPDESLFLEELLPDDMAYDADIEVVQPDGYEDVDSDVEEHQTPIPPLLNTEDELANKMSQLHCQPDQPISPNQGKHGHGTKRGSKHFESGVQRQADPNAGLEVTEVAEIEGTPPPSKRRKRVMRRQDSIAKNTNEHFEAWADLSDRTGVFSPRSGSTTLRTPSRTSARQEFESMDID